MTNVQSSHTHDHQVRSGRFRWKWVLLGVIVAIPLCIGGALLIGSLLWHSTPSYWQPTVTNEQTEERAQQFFMVTLSELTQPRDPDTEWELKLDQEELNDWLASDMPGMLAEGFGRYDIPDWAHDPMVVFQDDRIVIAARVEYEGVEQVVSAAYEPYVDKQGHVWLHLDAVYGGRLPLPAGNTADRLIDQFGAQDDRDRIQSKLNEMREIELPPFDLKDGRSVRITHMKIERGEAVVRCRTIAKEKILVNLRTSP